MRRRGAKDGKMSRKISRALVIVNLCKEGACKVLEEVKNEAALRNIDLTIWSFEGVAKTPPDGDFDIAISLGGDGTVLFSARVLAHRKIPILPINVGTLGFIAAVPLDAWQMVLDAWVERKVSASPRLMLKVRAERRGRVLAEYVALNDAVVAAAGISKIIRLQVGVDSFALGHYRADGLIIATPTGSTAYSVAAGGPILDPEMDVMIINPVCPFTLSNRAIVIPDHERVNVELEKEQRSDILLTVDGQEVISLEPLDRVLIERARDKALLIACDRKSFYKTLRTKLNWSGGPDA